MRCEYRTGLLQDPYIGTHISPRSATAMGGIMRYCSGVHIPSHWREKNEIPSFSRPATCPNALHPIRTPSARVMHDRLSKTLDPMWRIIGFPCKRKTPDRFAGHLRRPACFSGQSSGVSASWHGRICHNNGQLTQVGDGCAGRSLMPTTRYLLHHAESTTLWYEIVIISFITAQCTPSDTVRWDSSASQELRGALCSASSDKPAAGQLAYLYMVG